MVQLVEELKSNEEMSQYERNLRNLYHIDNVKRGLQNMEELNEVLGKPLDSVRLFYF